MSRPIGNVNQPNINPNVNPPAQHPAAPKESAKISTPAAAPATHAALAPLDNLNPAPRKRSEVVDEGHHPANLGEVAGNKVQPEGIKKQGSFDFLVQKCRKLVDLLKQLKTYLSNNITSDNLWKSFKWVLAIAAIVAVAAALVALSHGFSLLLLVGALVLGTMGASGAAGPARDENQPPNEAPVNANAL